MLEFFDKIFSKILSHKGAETSDLHNLKERAKELKCLYNIANITGTYHNLDEIFPKVVNTIPQGWQFTKITTSKIIFDQKEYFSEGFVQSNFKISEELIINGEKRGSIEVYYTQEKPNEHDGPFLKEEVELLENISSLIKQNIEKHEAQIQLENKKELLDKVGEIAKVGGWEVQADSLQIGWTKQTHEMFDLPDGYIPPLEDSIGYFHPDDREVLENGLNTAWEKGIGYDLTLRIITVKGAEKIVHTICRPIIQDGKVVKLTGIIQDITELKKNQQIIESLSKFPSENPYPVMRISTDGKIMYHNHASSEVLDFWGISDHDTLADEQLTKLSNALKKDKITNQQIDMPDKSLLLKYVPIKGENYLNVYGMDITKLVHAEKKIKAMNVELEQRVQQRTAQLKAVNQELESFAYSVSHDLRAPLRAIDGFSNAIIEDCRQQLDQTAIGYFDRIRNASNNMAQLIDDVLTLSRITRSDFKMEKVNLSEIAKDIVEVLKTNQADRNINWRIQPDLIVNGDKVLLKTMLQNLLENAFKFTSKKESARIEFAKYTEHGKDVYFVRDNGAGFDMKYSNKLFMAFQRLHTKNEFHGTGIGLATVQRVINRHGGKIWCKSEINQGACFYFTL